MVRAQVEPIHVDQVHPGQEAVLRFSAFPARTTPEFGGRVVRVSADAQLDERTGLSWYEVELSMGAAVEPDPETGVGTWPGRAAQTAAGWLPEDAQAWLHEHGPSQIRSWMERAPAVDSGAANAGAADGKGAMSPERAPSHAHDLALAPGMPVEVYLRTGERSPLSYLAKPLTDYFSRSLKEE